MGTPDAKKWAERIRLDLEWRKSNVDGRMNRALMLLNPSVNIRDKRLRAMAPVARRVARGLTTMDFLHRLPHIDAEYKGADDAEDQSNFIEDIIVLVADRAGVREKLKQLQSTLLWSPVSFAKVGMHLVGIQRDDGKSEATPEMVEGTEAFRQNYEEVPPELVAELELRSQRIPETDGTFMDNVKKDPLPSPTSSLDVPWCDIVSPFHIVCDKGINEFKDAYYVAHLFCRTKSQFKNSNEFINKDKVLTYAASLMEGKDSKGGPVQHFGAPLMRTFDIPSAEEFVVLAEVYIREDPGDSNIKQVVGVIDLMSGVWVKEPRSNPLGVYPYISIKAADESPGIWSGPSYIEQAWDDIKELAWGRIEFKKHVEMYRSHKDLIPESVEFDPKEWEKYEDPSYSGPVRVAGGPSAIAQIKQAQRPPAMPPALIQWKQLIEEAFSKNTGITATQQGDGSSNKVATAFRQEARFADERRSEIRYRIYMAYSRIMMLMTYYLQRYMTEPVEVKRGSTKFQFSGDTLRGIMGYTLDVIDLQRTDPLSDRLMEIQTIERLLSNPVLAQEFNTKELAKRIAQLNRWGNRVLASEAPEGPQGAAQPAQGPPGGNQSGTPASLGSGVDSAQQNGDTETAVEGAPGRRN